MNLIQSIIYIINFNIRSTDADNETATAIILRCQAIRPNLISNAISFSNAVGFRPCRKGGVRIEAEWKSTVCNKVVIFF